MPFKGFLFVYYIPRVEINNLIDDRFRLMFDFYERKMYNEKNVNIITIDFNDFFIC